MNVFQEVEIQEKTKEYKNYLENWYAVLLISLLTFTLTGSILTDAVIFNNKNRLWTAFPSTMCFIVFCYSVKRRFYYVQKIEDYEILKKCKDVIEG
jgi:hypothetical protein